MRITVLIENTAEAGLTGEHGLSLWVEFKGKRYLLDAGSSGAFLDNAGRLGIPVEEADACVLSHGHYDHAGGFAAYLAGNPGARVYAMERVKDCFYSASGGVLHEIGVPETVWRYREQFHFIREKTRIGDGVYLLPHCTGYAAAGERAGLFRGNQAMGLWNIPADGEALQDREASGCQEASLLPDDFSHELSLVFETARSLVVCSSCSHSGAVSIVEEAKAAFPGQRVRAFVGGLHMKGKQDGKEICTFSGTEVEKLAEYLRENVEELYTGHCTGAPGYELLRTYLGGRIKRLTTGMQMELYL